jgi:hypothetical protein
MRLSLKPQEYQFSGVLGGHYRIALPLTGGLTGISGAGIIVGFRWTSPSLLAIVKRISVNAGTRTVAGSTAFVLAFDAVKVTGYSTQHSSGGTAVTFGSSYKLRSSMANSLAAIYYASSTSVISGGTGTTENFSFGTFHCDTQPVTTGITRVGAMGDIYKSDAQGAHEVVLGANEGFYVRFTVAQGTSAVTDAFITIEWAEAMQY